MESIAKTKSIDTWILFPLSTVNRLLRRDAQIPDGWRRSLDAVFGETVWYDELFQRESSNALFGEEYDSRAKVGIEKVAEYYNRRLNSIFAGVASNPLILRNPKKNTPLFLLCFAVANDIGAPAAIRIAEHILSRPSETTPSLPMFDDD